MYIILETGRDCKLFGTAAMLSLNHRKSRSASSDRFALDSNLPFDFYSASILHLYNVL